MRPLLARTCFPIFLLLWNLFPQPARSQENTPALQIVVIEGEGGINTIGQRIARDPVVEVEDQARKPLGGATVVFFLPNQGPGGTFPNGTTTLTATTDALGRATARGIRVNGQAGTMRIRVTASAGGQMASAVITQNNVSGLSGSNAKTGMSRTTKLLIVLGVVAVGAGVGIAVASHGGSSSSSSGGGPGSTATLTPGTPTVGAPQ